MKYKSLIKGIEASDSFCFNAHKTLGTPLSTSILMVRNKQHLLNSFKNEAEYLYQTDTEYNKALKICIENINQISICAGTHNEYSSGLLVKLMKENNIMKNDNRVYFSQLLGMSDHISYNAAKAGFNVAKYVPYGPIKDMIPYLIRRAEENTSISGQIGRELQQIILEKKRRKKG